MDKANLRTWMVLLFGLILMTSAKASAPLWTFATVSGFPPSITLNSTSSATIKYTVTNQSKKTHTLQMTPIQGITPSGCSDPLGYQQSCTLNLNVNGSALTGNVIGGPVLCEQGNPIQCYQPSQTDRLSIRAPIAQYTVSASAGANGSVSPNGSQTVNSGDTITFTAIPASGFGVNQWLLDGNLVQTGGTTYQLSNITANHTVSVSFSFALLSTSTNNLVLSVTGIIPLSPTYGGQLTTSGTPRTITITNTSTTTTAQNVTYSNSSSLPTGTTIFPSACDDIAPQGTCTLTITPSTIPSAAIGDTTATPIMLTISGTNTNVLVPTVSILTYGSFYQSGYLFSITETADTMQSIGGVVAQQNDLPNHPWLNTPGTGSVIAADQFNGRANTNNINAYIVTHPSAVPSAAHDCTLQSGGNWYLPAGCQMGYGTFAGLQCGSQINPAIPNMQTNLLELGGGSYQFNFNSGAGYWSSTQFNSGNAFVQQFVSGGSGSQNLALLSIQVGVRCVQAITP